MTGFVLRREGDTQNPTSPQPLGTQTTDTQLAYWRRDGNQTFLLALLGGGERLLTGETSDNGFHGEGFFDGIDWYRFRGYLLKPYDAASDSGDYIFHKGYETDPDLGYADPHQGRPHFFPELDFTFSGRPYVEVRLPANLHDGQSDPVESEVRLRTACVWDYDALGNRIGAAPTFTSNVARHVAFIARRAGLDLITEWDWASWTTKFKVKCDEGLGWELGLGNGLTGEYFDDLTFTQLVLRRIDELVDFRWGQVSPVPSGRPAWQNVFGGDVGENAGWVKSAATGWSNSNIDSTLVIVQGQPGSFRAVISGMTVLIGLAYAQNAGLGGGSGADYAYSIQCNSVGIATLRGTGGAILATGIACNIGDEFGFDSDGTNITFLKNGQPLSAPGTPTITGDLYASATGFHQFAGISSATMDPAPGSLSGDYAIKWTGYFQAKETGDHNFFVNANDGVKLIVNETTLIDDLGEGSLRERSGTITLTAGQGYTFELQYKRFGSDGQITLLYSTSRTSKQPVPKAQLYSDSSVLSSGRSTPQFESDVVFDGMPWPQALDILMMRAPGVKWQRVNGKVFFMWANERLPVKRFVYETGIPFTVNPTTNLCLCDDHGLSDGDMLRLKNFTGTMPGGLQAQTTYYVRDKTADTFKVSLTLNGAAVDITDEGAGETLYTQKSNIVQNSVVAQRTDPLRKPNFLIIGYRDKDDEVFKQAWVEIKRPDLIEANDGRPIDPGGIQQIGVARASLAGRIGEALIRRVSDRDIEVQLKGQKSSHEVAKCDLIELVHPRGGWRLTPFEGYPDGPLLMEIVSETFDSTISTANEKSFIARIWYPEYDATAHGPLTGKPPGYMPSPLDKPPAVTDVDLAERASVGKDGVRSISLDGLVDFAGEYKFPQQGRVWWRNPDDAKNFTADAGTDVLTTSGHGYTNGMAVMVESTVTLPSGLDDAITYFIVNATANTHKLARTRDGSPVDIGDAGTGDHTIAPFVLTDQFIAPTTEYQGAFSIAGVIKGIHKIKVVSESQMQQQLAFELHPTWELEVLQGDIGGAAAFILIDEFTPTKSLSLVSRSSPALTTNRVLAYNVKNGDRSLTLGGDLAVGDHNVTLTTSGTTNLTLPTSGTLATTAQLISPAAPSAQVGLTMVPGSASTYMRSDAAPALDVSIAPTWSGIHTFGAGKIITPDIGASVGQRHIVPAVASDTVALLAATQALTNKTYNGLTINSTTGVLAITNSKTLTVQNSLTFSGADSKALVLTGGLTVGVDTSITGGGTLGLGGFTTTFGGNTTISGGGTLALGGFTFTVPATGTAVLTSRTITEGAGLAGNTYDLSANRTLAMGLPSTLSVSSSNSASGTTHSHAITSSTNPGAAEALLKSDTSGQLTLVNLLANTTTFNLINVTATTVNFAGAGTAITIGSAGGFLTINNPTINLNGSTIGSNSVSVNLFNTTTTTLNFAGAATALAMGNSAGTLTVNSGTMTLSGTLFGAGTGYTTDIGQLSRKFRMIHAAELTVETLIAQDTMATMGGRFIVPKGATLISADLGTGGTTITVKHNNLANGDRIWMESDGKFEMMAVTSSAGGVAGAYTYTVTRNLDGTGANQWYAGDSVVNTGTTGDGFIELYAYGGRFAGTGPTIVGNVRTGTTYNQIEPRWAIGNLIGLYGYGSTTYGAAFGIPTGAWLKIDPTNGVRIGHNTTTLTQIDAAGNATFAGIITAGSGSSLGGWTSTTTYINSGTTYIASGFNAPTAPYTWMGNSAAGYSGFLTRDASTRGFDLLTGNGSIYPYLGMLDGVRYRVVIGGLNFAFGSDGSTDSMGMKIWDAAGVKLVEFSDVQNTICGFTVGSDYLRDAANSFGLASTVTGGDDVRFWAGNTFANRATAPFRLTEAGAATMTNLTATGTFTLNSGSIAGPLTMSGASSSIAIGSTPPTSATVGTGIWLDRTGMYGLASGVQQAIFDATGKITAGAGNVTMDSNGLSISATSGSTPSSKQLKWIDTGTAVGAAWTDYFSGRATSTFEARGKPSSGNSARLELLALNDAFAPVAVRIRLDSASSASGYAGILGDETGFSGLYLTNNSARTNPLAFFHIDQRTSSSSNAMTESLLIQVAPNAITSPAQAGYGTSVLFRLESTTTNRDAARIGTLWTTASDASRTSAVVIQTVNSASALTEVARFAGNGDATITGLLKAGSGPTTLTDAAGKILSAALNTVAIAQGGTGLTTLTSNYLYKGAGASALVQSLIFDNGTNVGIGTGSSPAYHLQIAKNHNASTYLAVTNTDNTDANSRSRFAAIAGTVTMEFQAIATAGGYFGTSSNHGFVIYTNGGTRITVSNTGSVQFNTYGAGTLVADASGVITSSSDERLKNIAGPFTRGIESLRGLQPVMYRWLGIFGEDTHHVYTGFTTQNVGRWIPEGVFRGIRYDNLWDRAILATVVNAVIAQDRRTLTLESRTLTLESRVDVLTNKITELQRELATLLDAKGNLLETKTETKAN